MKRKVIIITGMHRSGTSLLTSILQDAGLFVGDNLIEGYTDNVKGYFEESDFVNLHRIIMRESKSHAYSNRPMRISPRHIELANELIEKRNGRDIWGFKDPRTSLFLEFWKERIPDSKFIFVYRSPVLVINSLIKRKTDKIIKRFPHVAMRAWINYNSQIISFYENNRNECILFNIDEFVNKTSQAIKVINEKVGLNLEIKTSYNRFDPKLLSTKSNNYKSKLINSIYFFKSKKILKELEKSSARL